MPRRRRLQPLLDIQAQIDAVEDGPGSKADPQPDEQEEAQLRLQFCFANEGHGAGADR